MTALYITYIDFDDSTSGSVVRPQKMLDAFREAGLDVKLLSGTLRFRSLKEMLKTSKSRKLKIAEINRWLNENRPDFCYIEPNSTLIMTKADIKLLKRLNKMKIPTAFFVRDFHYKFKQFNHTGNFLNKLKTMWIKILGRRTEKLISCVDITYFPSVQSFPYFNYKDMRALPPAGENLLTPKTGFSKTCIYVGGLQSHYGFDLLINSFKILNCDPKNVFNLILVCRKDEFNTYGSDLSSIPWLEIHHASGKELAPLYKKSDLALIPRGNNPYNDFAISVKLFEYASYGLPIVTIKKTAMGDIIEQNQIGLVTDLSAEQFSSAIKKILDDHDFYEKFRKNTMDFLLSKNLWIHRADQVIKNLSEYQNKP